ncbi:hypothetical protein B1748_09395 [Paenibacillus sp. MY03]|uniref:hypothetical protein n=1 Tax=Paenibacillus sp. MY03 TaxID=302980 RepID=UPI000B3C1F4B|nr:hypothetical protein [Paenibacillus sp. MY03]OUS76794.1 hypothetical protein B1748_09395 [Paenibacillus sp. MY03]
MDRELPPQSDIVMQSTRNKSLSERIWQYKFHYIIVIPAFFLVFGLKIMPFLNGLYASFLEYKPHLGIGGSPWVGWDNYKALFQSPEFRSALGNTLTYKIIYIVAGGVLAFGAALALSGIRSGKLRSWITSMFVLPYVIPSVVLGHFAMLMFSATSSPLGPTDRLLLGEPGPFRMILLALELLKYGGISMIIALAAISATHSRFGDGISGATFGRLNALPAAKAVAAVMLLQLAMITTTDFELLHPLISPLVMQTAATVDIFVYQMGFMNMNFGPALAGTFFSYGLQLALALAAYFIVRGTLLDSLFQRDADPAADLKGGSAVAGGVVGVAGTGLVLFVLYFIFVDPFLSQSSTEIPLTELLRLPNVALSAVLFWGAMLISMLVTITLAYPMTARRLPGGTLYRIMLIAVMGIGTGTLFEYLQFRWLGMVNTIYPIAIVGFINIVSAFVLKSIFNGQYGHLKEQAELEGRGEFATLFTLFLPKIWKPLLALGALQFIVLWNSYLPSLLYIADYSKHLGMMQFLNAINMSDQLGIDRSDPILYRIGALLSLPPLVLFLLLRKWIVGGVLLGGLFKR